MHRKILIFSFLLLLPALSHSYEKNLTDQQVLGALENNRLREVFERYLATILMYDPERATRLGIHDSDHMLTLRSMETINDQIESFTRMRKDLQRIDKDTLYPYLQVDYALLDSMLEMDIYNYSTLNYLARYPHYYLQPLELVYTLMNKESGNYTTRSINSIKRLKAFPETLLQAERNISHPPRIWTEYTIELAQSAHDNISDFFPLFKNYIKLDPAAKTDLDDTIDKVRFALERYIDFLKKDTLRKSDGDPQAGEYTFGVYLERWHGLNMTTASAYRYVKSNLKDKQKALEKEAENFDPITYERKGWKGVVEKLSKDHPGLNELVRTMSNEINRAANHFDEYKVVQFPKQRLLIKSMPAFMQIILPYAAYIPPYPLDEDRIGEIYLSMPDEKSDKNIMEKKLSSLYSYNNIELLVSELAVPGMHLRYFESYKNISKIRKIANQPVINNGWLCYSELLAEEMGYYSSMQQMMFLRKYLSYIRAARAFIDVAFHTKKMTYEESVKFFSEKLGFPEAQAKKEVIQISINPTNYLAYVIGFDKIVQMRRRYKKTEDKYFDLRSFHSDLLQLGNIQIEKAASEMKRLSKKEKGELDD